MQLPLLELTSEGMASELNRYLLAECCSSCMLKQGSNDLNLPSKNSSKEFVIMVCGKLLGLSKIRI